ncbi:hypothetical protein ACWZEH_18995 [Streptomyces sp. QTS137]
MDIHAALVVGPESCAVEVGVEVDLHQDSGTLPAGARPPYLSQREGIPIGGAFAALCERVRSLTELKDPFTATPAPHS